MTTVSSHNNGTIALHDHSTADPSGIFSLLWRILADNANKIKAPADWSSAIGIVTAIIGNLLISLALNTQRYAHIRLEKEYLEREKHLLRSRSGRNSSDSYGTSRGREAENGAHKTGKSAQLASYEDDDDRYDSHETDPLLPRVHSPSPSTTQHPDDVEDDKGDDGELKKKPYLKSPWWWLGITLMVVGEAGNFLAYGFAPASVVSPLGVVALISNCLIAPLLLREKFRWRDALGVVISIGGAVTIVTSAAGSNPKLGPGTIWNLIRRWQFEAYLGITFGAILVLMFLSNYYGDKIIVIDLGLVGLFGGYTALSTKGVASLISYRLWAVVTYPVFYLLLAVLIVTAIMQIKYVNRALQHFDSTQVIPTQFVMFTIFVIVGSAILYQDFEKKGGATIGQFVGGCVLTFLGVWCLTGGRGKKNDNEQEETTDREGDEEQAIVMVDEEYNGSEHNDAAPQTPRRPTDKFKFGLTVDSSADTPATFATANSKFEDPLDASTSSRVPFIHTTISSPILPSATSTGGDDPFKTPTPTPSSKLATQTLQDPATSPRPRTQQRASDSNLLDPENTVRAALPLTEGAPDVDSAKRYSTPNPLVASSATPSSSLSRSRTAPRSSPRILSDSVFGGSLRTPTRQSITAGMIPGPLTRPLAGGFTSVVANSRRMEERRASERARRDSLTRSRGNSSADAAQLQRVVSSSRREGGSSVGSEGAGGLSSSSR